MTTAPTQIGHCEVLREIGRGGMGVVYLARDTRLDREVAVKALPEEMAGDPDRLARFEREARLLASLSHPNVATVHGLEDHDGHAYLIYEYVEGEDLSHRLQRGAMPIDDALEIASQIAAALSAAHDKGVIHRDLKPGNVRITPSGTVKVLDFGLAKSLGEAASASPSVNSPTIPLGASPTMPGVMLGTAGYMSPEQARGKEIDKRSDIFSFGCVLYEMLAGTPTFEGETVTDSVGASLHVEPDWSKLPSYTPGLVRHLLHKCLEKDRKRRLQDIADARVELDDAGAKIASGQIEVPAERHAGRRDWMMPTVIAALAVALIAVLLWQPLAGVDPDRGVPLITAMRQLTDLPGSQGWPSLSPDGRMMLYSDDDDGDEDIFLQRVGGENPINLTESFGGADFNAAFSPDGEMIAFHSAREGGGIFIMGATGESPRRLIETGFHPAWSPDGRRIAYSTARFHYAYGRGSIGDLWTVDIETRETTFVTKGDAVGAAWSPGGGRIAYWLVDDGQRDIATVPADGGHPTLVTDDIATDWNPMWSPDGETLYFISDRGGSPDVWRIAIDEDSGEASGEPQPVTSGVAAVIGASMAADGSRMAITVSSSTAEVLRFDMNPATGQATGAPRLLYSSDRVVSGLNVSLDGRMLAYRTGGEEIYVMQTDGTGRRRLTDNDARDRGPRWSPDGQWLAFYTNRTGRYEAWIMRPDGTDAHPVTGASDTMLHTPVWSPDGRKLAINNSTGGGIRVAMVEFDGRWEDLAEPLPITHLEGAKDFVVSGWSPNGQWLIGGQQTRHGRAQLAVHDLRTDETRILRSPDGATFQPGSGRGQAWMDEHRMSFWDNNTETTYVWDSRTDTITPQPDLPGPAEYNYADGGRTLYLNRQRFESDVWLLDLQSPDG